MDARLSLTESQTLIALRGLLLAVLPAGVPVVEAQVSRVSEPEAIDFVLINSILRERLATNVHDYLDCSFAGGIAGNTLTVTAVDFGVIQVGRQVFGPTVTPGTTISGYGSGAGGIGTYTVDTEQFVVPQAMAAGELDITQSTRVSIQIDVHGNFSADNAQIITTALRDDLAVQLLADSGYDVAPLYTDEPRQIPFINAQNQIENRWIITGVLQTKPTLIWPQQFAGALAAGLKSVDVYYPAA